LVNTCEYRTTRLEAYHHRNSEALSTFSPALLFFQVNFFQNGSAALFATDSWGSRSLCLLGFGGAKAFRACPELLRVLYWPQVITQLLENV